VKSIEVVQKLCQLSLAVGPDDRSVIYVSEPTCRFVCHLL